MDIEKELVLIKNEEKTKQIESCTFSDGKWNIKFYNTDKVYRYSEKNVVNVNDPTEIGTEKMILYYNGQPLGSSKKILDFGPYKRVIFKNGAQKIYPSSALSMEQNALTDQGVSNCFTYLKELAAYVGYFGDEEVSLLKKQYNNLDSISPRSVLTTYLGMNSLADEERESPELIFPFGFNESQKEATNLAMTEQMSIIKGPPGTGKTQTILNIIANAIINNKVVAVVSNNNSATSNVFEKLEKYGIEFIAAFLGNSKNKEKFFNEQSGAYPDMSDWVLGEEAFEAIRHELRESQTKLDQMLQFQKQKAILTRDLSRIQLEYKYFQEYYSPLENEEPELKSFLSLNADRVLRFLVEYEQTIKEDKYPFKNKVINLFVYGIYNFKLYRYSPETVVSYLQKIYYEVKIHELTDAIEKLASKLDQFDFDHAMQTFSENSMKLFKASLADKYGLEKERVRFSPDILRQDFGRFTDEYSIILSTTHSLRNNVPSNYLFDYVLIDEASQVDIVTGALVMSCAKKAVIVGDEKQLPNVVTQDVEEKTTNVFNTYNLNSAYHYADHSLLTSVHALFDTVATTLLKEHYRCHPQIIGFCNEKFYHDELVVLTEENEDQDPLVVYETVTGDHARGTVNQRQIDVISQEVFTELTLEEDTSVGIVAPFRLQANKLQQTTIDNTEADTVHKYQGREKDIIILSTVANNVKADDFVDNANLINVAVSRAVKKLVVVVAAGSREWHGTNIGDLIRYITYRNFKIVQSQIRSVFDLLYRDYHDKLMEVLTKHKKVSEYNSENLMNVVIKKVLEEDSFQTLDYVLHQPLRMLLKDTNKLTEAEREFALNIRTHTDFLIFNKMDKMPVLVVEVDGYAFHANDQDQLKRDAMKDAILQKYDVPILRLETTGSEEEKVLRNKMLDLLSLSKQI
ncbi:AAA family ATPase [Virgibacillus sp. NKC19-3]|uniref:AAA domain-containing protein n=1 Tax=Virgibacillus saliphilus TaxID=2831674 RepID=UPI001C9B6AA8|nr:AAA domain-containing protein [Virgibacillus sp. NKC19-3]MBY7141878.1 AAA family ATPase [Virgibacillus sp. NKC19-3]